MEQQKGENKQGKVKEELTHLGERKTGEKMRRQNRDKKGQK